MNNKDSFIDNDKENICLDSFYEIFQDNFIIALIGEIIKQIKDIEARSALEEFISEFSPIFIYEAYKFLKNKKLIKEENFFNSIELKKKVSQYRMATTKRKVSSSSYIKEIIQKMGISLNEDVFDINIVLNNNKVNRFNFSNFIKQEDSSFFGGCYTTNYDFSRVIFKTLTNLKYENYNDITNLLLENFNQEIIKLEKELSGERYCYKSSKIFSNSKITEDDKYFILYRYNMLNIIKILKKFFSNINFSIELNGMSTIRANNFFRKICALEIVIIGNDIQSLKTEYTNILSKKLDEEILPYNNQFYSINRAFRNNIHYETIYKYDENKENIDNLQNKYIDIVIRNMLKEMNINIDEESESLTRFFYKCNELNIDKKEIDENYEDYYTQFILLGTIHRKNKK